jgi:hypothetical protein
MDETITDEAPNECQGHSMYDTRAALARSAIFAVSLFSPLYTSHFSNASEDVPKPERLSNHLRPLRVTTLGKTVGINATVTTPPSLAPSTTSNSKVPMPSTLKPAQMVEGSRDVDFCYARSPGGQVATCDEPAAIIDVGHRADAPGETRGDSIV